MPAPRLSETQENALVSALGAAAGHIETGDDPNTALAKAAQAADLPEGHLPLLVCAYNTGRTQDQLASSDDPMEKAADFQLANLEDIRKILYPAEIKTAAQLQRGTEISPEYLSPPRWYTEAKTPEQIKVAAERPVRIPERTTVASYSDLPEIKMRKFASLQKSAEQVVDAMRTETIANELQLTRTLDDLKFYFQKNAGVSFTRAVDDVETLFPAATVAVLKFLGETNPEFKKQAMSAPRAVYATAEPYNMLFKAAEQAKAVVASKEQYKTAKENFDADFSPIISNENMQKVAAEELDFFAEAPAEKYAASAGSQLLQLLGVQATRDAVVRLGENLRGPEPEARIRKTMERLSSPEHEMNLGNVRMRANIQELLATDPVISGHDPQKVVNVFNELSQLAPRVTSQPAALRSLLRKQLEQEHLEPFEVSEITKLDQSLGTRTAPIPQSGAA